MAVPVVGLLWMQVSDQSFAAGWHTGVVTRKEGRFAQSSLALVETKASSDTLTRGDPACLSGDIGDALNHPVERCRYGDAGPVGLNSPCCCRDFWSRLLHDRLFLGGYRNRRTNTFVPAVRGGESRTVRRNPQCRCVSVSDRWAAVCHWKQLDCADSRPAAVAGHPGCPTG